MERYEGVKGRVSVVTPVYNGERHLHRLLESVLAQSWNDIEMILSDDGSQDGTLEAARAFQSRFRDRGFSFRVLSAEHRNASAAISRALPLVTGEFLIWPDSDDSLHPDSIRARADFLRANPQYQCVRSLPCYRGEDGGPAPPQENLCPVDGEELFFPVLMGESFVSCGCYMLRCQAFFSIYPQRRIPEFEWGQNFQMLLPFLYRHRCPTLPEELYTVYVTPNSHSRRQLTPKEEEEKYAAYEALIDQLADICPLRRPEERRQIALWKYRRRFALYKRQSRPWKALAALSRLWVCGDIPTLCALREGASAFPFLRRLWRGLRQRIKK